MRKRVHAAAMLLLLTALSGCNATFREKHHFATINEDTGEVQNIFRVTVRGDASMTNARYVAGFYDERAVDLFFNEIQSKPLSDVDRASGAPPIFRVADCSGLDEAACKAKQEQVLRMVPVGADLGNTGTFVMILSTNADAIANTIGSFAENDAVMNSVMYLATRDRRVEAAAVAATAPINISQRNATIGAIESLSGIATGSDSDRTQKWLAVLRATAAGLSPDAPPSFATIAEARTWLASARRRGE